MNAVIYLDACPECPPGIPPASPPVGDAEQVPGGIVTAHQCAVCAVAWETFWRDGWPVERLLTPVSPDRASRDRQALDGSLRGAA